MEIDNSTSGDEITRHIEIDNHEKEIEQQLLEKEEEENTTNVKVEEEKDSSVVSTVSISLSSEEQVSNSQQSPDNTTPVNTNTITTTPTQEVVQSSVTLHHDAKLIQVCGEEPFHFIPVPLSYKSLNLEDAFIMQSDAYMFVWSSNDVTSQKKAKAIQMAQKLKAEIGCQRAVQVLEIGEEHPTFTFCLGVAKGTKLEVTKEKNDIFQVDEDDQVLEPEFYLYKLASIDGKLNFIPIDEPEIKQDMFESNSCFIMDCEHEIFIWQGKSSTKSERECCIPLAKKIQTSFDRPETFTSQNSITLVCDGSEGCIFKSKFKSGWKEKQVFSYLSGMNKKKADLTFDVVSMHTDKEVPAIHLGSNDNKGKLLLWSCSARGNGKWTKVDEDDFGIFYSSKSYVCHFIYKPENKNSIKSAIFYWEGMYSNHRNYISYKFGLYKDIQKKMQSLQSDDPIEYRISQNKEPNEFFQLFGTEILILNDELSTTAPKSMMIQVRGVKGSCRGTQLQEISASKLNSMDSFVFIFPGKAVLVWYGKGSNEEERLLASELVTFLPSEYEGPTTSEFEEGQESDSFWEFIGGNVEYPTHSSIFKPKIKLFLCTESTGIFKADEIKPFSQLDLNHEENVILDVHSTIFLWKGSKTTDAKFELSLKLVEDYISTIPTDDETRSKDSINYTILNDGEESELFKSFFVSWKYVAPKIFIDPLLKPKENVKLDVIPQEKVEEKVVVPVIEKVEERIEEPVVEKVVEEKLVEPVVEKVVEERIEEPVVEKVEEKVVEEESVVEKIVEEEVQEKEEIQEKTKEEVQEKVEELVLDNVGEKVVEVQEIEESEDLSKKSKSNNQSPIIQITPVVPLPSPASVSSSGDLLFAYQPFHSPIGSPKQSRKGGKKGGKNRNRNNNNNNNAQLSSSPNKNNRSIESLHLDSTGISQTKKNKKFHNRTGSFNH